MKIPSNIVFLITGLTFGGAEKQVTDLAISHARNGLRVHVISLIKPKAHVDTLTENGVEVSHLGMRRGVPDIRAIFRLIKKVKEIQPDIVHSHMVHANILARIANALSRGFPVLICTAHNTIDGGGVIRQLYKVTDRWTVLTTNVCQEGVDRFVKLKVSPADKTKLVHNGVDVKHLNNKLTKTKIVEVRKSLGVAKEFMWLSVGRIDDPQKNYPLLIRTFANSCFENSRLIIVGDGSQREKIQQMIDERSLNDRIQLIGLRDDVDVLMKVADAFVLASSWEGLPMVLLEASAAGLPIVATDVGGNSDIVKNGETGILVESENTDQLAESMCKIESMSDNERDIMGKAGSTYIHKTFDITNIVAKWYELYQDYLNSNAPLNR